MHYKVTTMCPSVQLSARLSVRSSGPSLLNILPRRCAHAPHGARPGHSFPLSDFQCEVMVLISAVTGAMIKTADSNSAAFMH